MVALGRDKRKWKRSFRIESLEDRQLLSTGPMISEFMAANDNTLRDDDGDRVDWIELYNPGTAPVDLGGWYLTDDAADPDKWCIPDGVTLDGGEYLLVYASDKDRTDPAAPLHTNFKLTSDGEYLALIDDQLNVVFEYEPAFPRQLPDLSYGITDSVALISPGDASTVWVPTDEEAGGDWTGGAEPYDDSAWQSGSTGVGYSQVDFSYDAVVLDDEPIAYYPLNVTSGTTASDATGHGHDGLILGGCTLGQTGAYDQLGSAIGFNGSDSRIRIPDDPAFDLGTGDFTIEMWFNTSVTARGDLFTYKVGTGADFGIHSSSQTAGRISVYHNDYVLSGTRNFDLGVWHHLALTRSSGTLTLFMDGQVAGNGSDANSLNISNDLLIGSNFNPTIDTPAIVFNGLIDEVAVYGKALSTEMIARHIQAAKGISGDYGDLVQQAQPIAYYPMDDSELIETAADQTGSVDGLYHNLGFGDAGSPGAIAGDADTAVRFDGADNYVSIDRSVLAGIGTGDFTIEMWFDRQSTARGDLFNLKNAGIGDLGIFIDASASLRVWWDGQVLAGSAVSNNAWHHLAMTRTGTTITVYLDGAVYGTGTSNKDINAIPADVVLGMNNNAGAISFPFNGLIDEMAFYSSALSPAQIQQHIQAARDGVSDYAATVLADSPLGYYRLGEEDYHTIVSTVDYPVNLAIADVGMLNGRYLGFDPDDLEQPGPLANGVDTAVRFDGVDNRVFLDRSALAGIGTGDFSVELWFNKSTAGVRGDLFNFKSAGTADLGIFIDAGNQFTVWWNNAVIANAGVVSMNQWHHLVLTRSGAALTLYLDGAVYNTGTSDADLDDIDADILIGSNHDDYWSPTFLFGGLIDEVAIYPTALDAARVTAHYGEAADPSGDYAQTVRDDAPNAYYRFGETPEQSAAGFSGTAVRMEMTDLGGEGIPGTGGTSLNFDGTDNRVAIDRNIWDGIGAGSFAIEMWFNQQEWARGDLFNLKGTGGDLGLFLSADGTLDVYWTDSTYLINGAVPVEAQQWHHVVLQREGTTVSLWLDGEQYATATSNKNINTIKSDVWIGSNHDAAMVPALMFNGLIDEVAFYDQSLSAIEIMEHWLVGADRFVPPRGPFDIQTDLTETMFEQASGAYLRTEFEVDDPAAFDVLTLKMQYDDGFVAYLNGVEVARRNAPDPVAWDSTATAERPNELVVQYESIDISAHLNLLQTGTNILAVHGLNLAADDSDFFLLPALEARLIDTELLAAYLAYPTPGGPNAPPLSNVPALVRDVEHQPQQPASNTEVTITAEVDDIEGLAQVMVAYQIVDPGAYIRVTDPEYATLWTTVPMFDDGTSGDEEAGDGVYTAVLPASLQVHRRLVRYRIEVTDMEDQTTIAPSQESDIPNFAYFVYDGIPDYQAAVDPGAGDPVQTFDSNMLGSVQTVQLIADHQDVVDSQYLPGTTRSSGYLGDDYLWTGTLVYNGVVYDHVEFRARGGVWRYSMGKNMWKFNFHGEQQLQMYDNYGQAYDAEWDKLNLGACIQQGDIGRRGEQGLFESVGFKMFNLAGVPSPETAFVQFRVVDDDAEQGGTQYDSDFWGLYLATEQIDENFLDQHDLEEGNIYKMEAGTGVSGADGELKYHATSQPDDYSDLLAFKGTYEGGTQTAQWWADNLGLDQYYSYRSILEAIRHTDVGAGKNYYYYNNPTDEVWNVFPWDVDLTWTVSYDGGGNEPFRDRVLPIAEYNLEYKNCLREIRDLLFNPEQTGWLIDEMASFIYTPGEPSFVDADRAMWDYNPILASSNVLSNKAGQGRYYASAATHDFAGMITQMKDYIVTRSAWIDSNLLTDESQIPATPTIAYDGPAGYPLNMLQFSSGGFSSPGSNFAAMQWRIADVTDTPGAEPNYEITAVWQSDVLTTFDPSIIIPGVDLEAGQTYRVRVRMQGDDGRWSHWSDPVEFTAGVSITPLQISEIMYNPPGPTAAEEAAGWDDDGYFEFIELTNYGLTTVDLTGVYFGNGITFNFTDSAVTELAPGGRVVVAADLDAFAARYGRYGAPVAGVFQNGTNLSNGGERVALYDGLGNLLTEVDYDDHAPWPEAADGSGASLELIDGFSDPTDPTSWRAVPPNPGIASTDLHEVLEHYLFYNNSAFDAGTPGADAADDGAIAPDKQALFTGQTATVANYTSDEAGITGIMIDMIGIPAEVTALSAGDFEFYVGNGDDTQNWTGATAPSEIAIRRQAGLWQTDRVSLVWVDGSIVDTWLKIVVKATANTGLIAEDVFYFGSVAGNVDSQGTVVDAADLIAVRNHPHGPANPAPIDNRYDINKDTLVDAADLVAIRNHIVAPWEAVRWITPQEVLPPVPPEAEGQPAAAASPIEVGSDRWFASSGSSREKLPVPVVVSRPLLENAAKTGDSVDHWAEGIDELLAESLVPRQWPAAIQTAAE